MQPYDPSIKGGEKLANNKFPPRAAKRRIETVYSRVSHLSQVAITDTILHTAEDTKTLVRTVLQLTANHKMAAQENISLALQHQPNGVEVTGLGIAESLDQTRPKALLWVGMKSSDQNGDVLEFVLDSSGMRKLQEGDTIVLKDVTVQANGYHIAGTVTLFFKE